MAYWYKINAQQAEKEDSIRSVRLCYSKSTATAILNSNSYNSMVVNAVTQTINLCVVEALK